LQDATARYGAKREQAQQAGQRLKPWMEEIEQGARAPFNHSDLEGEITKAENQADREVGLALDAMVVAAHSILQAQVAILKAFNTRKAAVDLARFRNTF
jgi:hypothetical protein